MKKHTALLGTVASLVLAMAASNASAATFLYTFSGTGGLSGASGTLEASKNSDGSYTATSGNIQSFGPVATGIGSLIPGSGTSPSGFFTYDSTLFPGENPLLSFGGLLFKVGANEVNIFAQAGADPYTFYNSNGSQTTGNFALAEISSAVPETATWAMMIAGFGMIGFAARRRAKTTVRVTYA